MKLKLNYILTLLCLIPLLVMGSAFYMEGNFNNELVKRSDIRYYSSVQIFTRLIKIENEFYIDYLNSQSRPEKIIKKIDDLIIEIEDLEDEVEEIYSNEVRGQYSEFAKEIKTDVKDFRIELFDFYNDKWISKSNKDKELNDIIFLVSSISTRLISSIGKLKVVEVKHNNHFRNKIKRIVLIGSAFVMIFLILTAFMLKRISEQLRIVSLRIGEEKKANKSFFIYDFDNLYQKIVDSNNLIVQQKREICISARNSEAGELTANLAHELKTPLAIISSGQTVLIKKIKKNKITPEEISLALEKNNLHIVKVGRVIDSIRKTARDSTDEDFSAVTLVNVLEDVEYASNYKLESTNVRFFSTFKDCRVLLICKEIQVIQIILNLINNSTDALKNLDEKWISVEGRVTEAELTLYFTDSGPGIPKDIADNMFERYYTTKSAEEGTGLGLDLCKKMMNEMGGDIKYDHTHENTRFILTFTKFKFKEEEQWEKEAS